MPTISVSVVVISAVCIVYGRIRRQNVVLFIGFGLLIVAAVLRLALHV